MENFTVNSWEKSLNLGLVASLPLFLLRSLPVSGAVIHAVFLVDISI